LLGARVGARQGGRKEKGDEKKSAGGRGARQ